MVRRPIIRYSLVLAGLLPFAGLSIGCGKSDSGPPPGATTTDVEPPTVTLGDPAGKPDDSAKPAEGKK